jgi:hypothetical protein
MGHNFGLVHDYANTTSIMSYGNNRSSDLNLAEMQRIYTYGELHINEGGNRTVADWNSNNWLYHTSTNEKPYFKNVVKGQIIPLIPSATFQLFWTWWL